LLAVKGSLFSTERTRTVNVYAALMAEASKTPNVYRSPHGYAAFRKGSSRVIVE
jgi:hypothetical protein